MNYIKKHSLISGLVLIFLLTWPIDLMVAAESLGLTTISLPLPIVLSVGLGFVIASLTMSYVSDGVVGVKRILRRFLLWRVNWLWYLSTLIIPVVNYVAILLDAALNNSEIDFSNVLARQLMGSSVNLWLVVAPWFIFTTLSNLEEIGWRGYVLPRLQSRYNALIASLVLGVIWWLWHLPKYLVGGFDVVFLWSFLSIMAQTIMLSWLYNNTKGSLLLVTLFHSAINTAAVVLPIANTVNSTGQNSFIISSILELLVAGIIVVIYGPERLSRTTLPQVQE